MCGPLARLRDRRISAYFTGAHFTRSLRRNVFGWRRSATSPRCGVNSSFGHVFDQPADRSNRGRHVPPVTRIRTLLPGRMSSATLIKMAADLSAKLLLES